MRCTILITLAGLLLPAFASIIVPVSYDTAYDNSTSSLSTVACSDGSRGLLTRGYTTFGSLPKFPYIGGAAIVNGWNSPNCGTCYQLTTTNETSGAKKSINVLVIDGTNTGFNIALAAMNNLTNGHAAEIGRLTNVVATQVPASVCGL